VNAHRVWAEIDLDALTHNLTAIRRRAGNGVRVVLVVKADAYGHGAVPIAHHALRCGVAAFGVGTSAEALELRQAGLRVPILVLGTIVDEEAAACLRNDVHIGLHSSDRLAMLRELAGRLGQRARVHLNVDTGMGGLGVPPQRALELLREVRTSPNVVLEGVMTHVASPEGALDPFTVEQAHSFRRVLDAARAEDLVRGWTHAASSASIFTGLLPAFDTVRPGISAYGILPARLPGAADLLPVMALRCQVVFLKDLEPGTPVGYGSTWRAERRTRVAVLPVGYNDGVAWRLSNAGEVLVRGRRAPIVGRVSMDYVTVDVGHVPGVRVGDTATLIGCDGEQRIGVEEVAERAGTISYEITCSVGQRVEHVYVGGEEITLPSQAPALRAPGGEAPRPGVLPGSLGEPR
jgi:alanine racemase